MKKILNLQCVSCGKEHKTRESNYFCNSCGGNLEINYDYKLISKRFDYDVLEANHTYNMWRYMDLLPIDDHDEIPPVQVGWTPLYEADELAENIGISKLFIKDEGRNPTGSIKDRGSAVTVARALELGASVITEAASGNASDSLACLTASLKLDTVIIVPKDTPDYKLTQLYIYGAKVIKIDGGYLEAYELCREAAETKKWYHRAAGTNPFSREGKKTCAFEICEQLHWEAPDKVIVAAGDGTIVSGLWKGFKDFNKLGIIEKMPQMIAVQAQGSAAITKAWEEGLETAGKVQASTIAESICINRPKDAQLALQAIRESEGMAITVTDEEILQAIPEMARGSSVFAEPSGAAPYAGVKKLAAQGLIKRDESVALIVGGSGFKDMGGVSKSIKISPSFVKPSLEEIIKIVSPQK